MEDRSQNPSNAANENEAKPSPSRQIEPPTPSYVKKKKRRAALWILVGATGAGVLTLGIIAFLGQNFGNFTVKLNNDEDAALQMGEMLAINSRGTGIQTPSTYLNVGGLTSGACIAADNLPDASILDCDITSDNYDDVMYKKKVARKATAADLWSGTSEDDSRGVYFNYTFYLRNISTEEVTYSIKYYCTANNEPSNLYDASGNQVSVSLEKFIRIRVYQNTYYSASAALPTHFQKTYAYPNVTTDGTALPETVSDPASTNPENRALCVNFSNWQDKLFTVFDDDNLALPGEAIVRYSVVMWFEGWDPDTDKYDLPVDGSLAFAIDISGTKTRSLESSSSVSE